MSSTVYLATCSAYADGDPADGELLITACADAGLGASWQIWDDPTVDWTVADLTVVRTTWDYTSRREEFLSWAFGRPGLLNPADVLRWNSDKRYLADLERAGVPVVPTTWVEPGGRVTLPTAGEFVVKPSVGAGSMGAARFSADDASIAAEAAEHVAALHRAGRTAMIQPYLGDVDSAGETALIFLDGRFSHAVRKGPMLPAAARNPVEGHSLYVPEVITPRTPSPEELILARTVIEAATAQAGEELLYARIDLLPTPDGPVLIELELVEPSLFLEHSDGAPDRLAAALSRRCGL